VEGKWESGKRENGAEGKRKASTAAEEGEQRHLGARTDFIIILLEPIDDDNDDGDDADGNAADAVIDVFATCFPKVFTLGITHVCMCVWMGWGWAVGGWPRPQLVDSLPFTCT